MRSMGRQAIRPVVSRFYVGARVVALAAVLGLCASAVVLGANASFVGTWRMDMQRSDPMMGNVMIENDYRLELSGENLDVVRVFKSQGQESAVEWTLQTDGEPHEIPGMREPRTVKARWKKDRLNITYQLVFEGQRGTMQLDVTELWTINKAGELEVRTSTRTQRGQQSRVEIFTRVE